MRRDADRDLTSGLPQVDGNPSDVLRAPDESPLGRLLRELQLGPRPPGETVAAFANFIGDRCSHEAYPRTGTAEVRVQEQSPFRLEVRE